LYKFAIYFSRYRREAGGFSLTYLWAQDHRALLWALCILEDHEDRDAQHAPSLQEDLGDLLGQDDQSFQETRASAD